MARTRRVTIWDPLDPRLVTDERERQRMAVFACCVPGKAAAQVWPKVQRFLDVEKDHFLPFRHVLELGWARELAQFVRAYRLSPYGPVLDRLSALAHLPRTWTWKDLEGKKHFGPKTVHFVALYTSPGTRVAALDVHILRWLGSRGHEVPPSTPPQGHTYDRLQAAFLAEADRLRLAPWRLDRRIWMAGREARKCPKYSPAR